MKPRAFLCSYPKSGRTWVRLVLAHAFNRRYRLGVTVDLDTLFWIVPNMGADRRRGTPAYRFYDRDDVPLVIADHAKFHPRFATWPVVLILRSVPDVLASYFFHARDRMHAFSGSPQAFVRDPRWGVDGLVRYLNSWSAHVEASAACVLTYEAMCDDPAAVAERVLGAIGVRVAQADLDASVASSSFDEVRRLEQAAGVPAPARRARAGGVGRHGDVFDETDLAYIRERGRSGFTQATAALLEKHGLALDDNASEVARRCAVSAERAARTGHCS